MSDTTHDPMCPFDLRQRSADDGCECDPGGLITRVRADERRLARERVLARMTPCNLPCCEVGNRWLRRAADAAANDPALPSGGWVA